MLTVFQKEILDADNFIVTLELVPGRYSTGKTVDLVKGIAADSFSDGRIAAVSITDNPGGNPSLSPDVLGHHIFQVGMDAIVHYTCRDSNRVGMESRALQLAMMGMKNLLALTGDYTGKGFGGRGAPVFDLGSVNAVMLLQQLSQRMMESGDPDGFFVGCAVSPFKYTEAECYVQYNKLFRKIAAGAQFIITQLGYDAAKFAELMMVLKREKLHTVPVLGSVYVLNPKAAKIMNKGIIPGVFVSDQLLKAIKTEWQTPKQGRKLAIERAAKLGAILKGLGYRGMHIGGIHKSFDTVATILDRMEEIEDEWQDFYDEFNYPAPGGFKVFADESNREEPATLFGRNPPSLSLKDRWHYSMMKKMHDHLFTSNSQLAPLCNKAGRWVDRHKSIGRIMLSLENKSKEALLDCKHCGDCGIQHVGFLCPESQCPKHTRNGQCGGSRSGMCEVYPEKQCVWVRAYNRICSHRDQLLVEDVPPRMWELNETSSWLNFHLQRDHQRTMVAKQKCKMNDDASAASKPNKKRSGKLQSPGG
jgi:methylenetetrahydrofolate reductase (NADPH)